MKQQLYKSSSNFGLFSHGTAHNKVIMCQFKETLADLDDESYISIYEFIRDINFDYYFSRNALREETHEFATDIDFAIKYCALTSCPEFQLKFKQSIVELRKPIVASYKKAFMYVMNKYKPCQNLSGFEIDDECQCQNEMMYFFEVSVIMLERHIMKKILKKERGSYILVFYDFKQEYLYDLTENVEGIIAKRFTKEDQIDYRFLQLFDIPIVKSNARLKHHDRVALSTYHQMMLVNPTRALLDLFESHILQNKYKNLSEFNQDKGKIKIFAPIIDDRFLDMIINTNYYSGFCPYRTEYEYKTFGMVPNNERIIRRYTQIMQTLESTDKEFMIRLPDLRPEKEIHYLKDLTTDLDNLYKYPGIFYRAIENIARVFGNHEHLVLILPMIMVATEVREWSIVIQQIFSKYRKPMPKLAIMISTEAAYDHIEDYADCNIDLVIVGLNDLFEEILEISRYQEVSLERFLDDCKFHVQNIHQMLRQMKYRHIFVGSILRNKEILHTFIKMGCREFCIPIEHAEVSFKLIEEYSKSKGRYVGTYHRQIELTALRRKILKETGEKPKNRYPKIRKKGNKKS